MDHFPALLSPLTKKNQEEPIWWTKARQTLSSTRMLLLECGLALVSGIIYSCGGSDSYVIIAM